MPGTTIDHTTANQWLKVAGDRGYTSVNMSGANREWYSLSHEYLPINLQIWPSKGEFSFTHMHGMLTVTSGNLSSFMSPEHFKKWEQHLQMAIVRLNN